MGRFLFYKCEIAPAIKGCENLTLEQAGLYWQLIHRIYATEDNLELVDHSGAPQEVNLARKCNCDVRTFRRVFAQLVAMQRLSTEAVDKAVYIRDERASIACRSLGDRFDQTAKIGRSNAGKPNHERGKSTTYADDPTVVEAVRYQIPEKKKQESPSSRTEPARAQTGRKRSILDQERREGGPQTPKPNGTASNRAQPAAETTIKDPVERLARFQQSLVEHFKQRGKNGWEIIRDATNVNAETHFHALRECKEAATELGKGWPYNWPTNRAPATKPSR